MKVECEHCGKSFDKKSAEVKRTKHDFCSKQCKSDYFSNKNLEGKYNVTDSGCWEFTGCLNKSNYGVVRYNKKTILAHRAMYMIVNGDESIGDLHVLHKCDNPKCINPDHLFLGTHKDNMDDMRRKNRSNSILSYNDVREIRESKMSNKELSMKYHVTERTIRYAKNDAHWMPLPEPPK